MQLFLLAPAIVVLWATQSAAVGEKPWFCEDYDCPLYTTEARESYVVRTYGATNWLTTSVVSKSVDASRRQKMSMFWKMFPYFNGRNADGVKVKMGVPALTKVVTRADGQYDISMMFYVPVENPPAPTVDGVSLVPRSAGQVYVKEFPMMTMPSKRLVASKAEDLRDAIPNKSSFDRNVYYSVGYSYPFSMKLKQYEVWMDVMSA